MRKTPAIPLFQARILWLLLGGFTLVNGLLAFAPLSLPWKAALALAGLAAPLGMLWGRGGGRTPPPKPVWKEDHFSFPPGWVLFLFILAAACFRFIHLTTLSLWPLTDEAKSGYFAMQLASRGWGSARLLYDFSQLPPLYIWLEGLFFKCFGVSLFSLWCFPALLSLAAVPVFYFAGRAHFSKSFALLLAGLMAFGFWPLYTGRFSHQGGLLLLWECLAFWLAGKLGTSNLHREGAKTAKKENVLSKASNPKNRAGQKNDSSFLFRGLRAPSFLKKNIFNEGGIAPHDSISNHERRGAFAVNPYGFYLGLLAGAGFYTFTSWPSVALVLALWVFFFHRRAFLAFLGGMILVYLPLGMAWLKNGYGGYILYVGGFHGGEAWGPFILQGFWDFCAFFWKSPVPGNLFAYKPFWGGYLNPLWGACFFLGAVVFLRQASVPWIRFGPLAFLFFYLPGFLTGGVEMFRIIPILPLLLAGVALGLSALLASLKRSWRWPVLGLFLLFSLGMDGYHLFGVYHGVWTHPQGNWFGSKSIDRLRAYQVLKNLQKDLGPGLILSDLVPDLYDQSLPLATYSFNTQENPDAGPSRDRWVAIVTNVHYQSCLSREFPAGTWIRLAPDMGWPDGGMVLGIASQAAVPPEALKRLVEADRAMGELVPLVLDNRGYRPRQPVVKKLISLYPLFEGDPFLESCFWEKIADNAYGDRNYEAQVAALRQAVEKGCPTAHLYNDLGALYFRRSRFQEARAAFEKALHCRPNYTSAAAGLALLEETEKTGRLPKD